jgi:hypothetical protein
MFDKIDIQIVDRVEKYDGQQVAAILKTLDCRTLNVLRHRLDKLEVAGCIILDRTSYRGQVRAHITAYGKQVLAEATGRAEQATPMEATVP